MPDIDVVGDVGASFEVDATFNVADVDHLTDFTKTLLTEESFDWVISGSNLSGESFSARIMGAVRVLIVLCSRCYWCVLEGK